MAIRGCVIAKVHNATDFQYLAFSSLDKHDNHITTTVEVKEMSSQSMWCGLANWQQAHVVIEIYFNVLNWNAKFYSSKSLTTPFIITLHRQTFAPMILYTQVCRKHGCHNASTHRISNHIATHLEGTGCSYTGYQALAWNILHETCRIKWLLIPFLQSMITQFL